MTNAGDIDRDKLGEMVFNHPEARRKLNLATHFPVALELARQLIVEWLSLTCVAVSCSIFSPQNAVKAGLRDFLSLLRLGISGGGHATPV